MTDEQAEALGRRWMACDASEWMAGMLMRRGHDDKPARLLHPKVLCEGGPAEVIGWSYGLGGWINPDARVCVAWPDVRDPATRGCLLGQVRDALGCPTGSPWHDDAGWWWDVHPHPTEAEALIAALEIA